MKRLSIKMRITLWFTAVMIVLCAALLLFLLWASEKQVRHICADTLRETLAGNLSEIGCEDGYLVFDDAFVSQRNSVYTSVYDEAGVFLYGKTPRGFDVSAPFEDGALQTLRLSATEWYVCDQLAMEEGYGNIWIRAVMSADSINQTYSAMQHIALMALPVLVLLSAVVGYMLTKRALLPVRQITETAERIGESRDLTRRIALGEGGDEIYVLANAFDGMFDRLENAFEKEKQFTSDASHELRTPTAVILSTCEYAQAHAQTLEEAKSAISAVQGQAQKMNALIAQLLMLSRADQGQQRLQRETVDLSELAEVVIEQMQEAAQERGIALTGEIEPHILCGGDETLLMRLLINLTENAIKYGKKGGWAKLTLVQRDKDIICKVSDNGHGIAPENLTRIWDRFYQEEPSRSTAQAGCGLGLSMAKWIAEAHGGGVTAESVQGEGSIFTFTIPKNMEPS